MATNKHAVIRYQALDKCFSNFGRRFYINDLIDKCNEAIYDFTGSEDGVKRRQIFDDITFMESEAGHKIPLERLKDGRKVYYRYRDSDFSINKTPISEYEAEQLKNTITMLNRFKGLPQFEWMGEVMTRIEDTFKLKGDVNNVVSFEQNPYLMGLNHYTELFNAIINKQVLKVVYRPNFKEAHAYIFHPYHLKQYNNRWFIFGLSTTDGCSQIMNMSIDRIESFEICNACYIENSNIDFDAYFDDVVGVTVPNNKEVETIRLKVDKDRYNYISSKPLHPSQTVKEVTAEYAVIQLKLIHNYEFETLLLGFADGVEVLEPASLRRVIKERADRIINKNDNCADRLHNTN